MSEPSARDYATARFGWLVNGALRNAGLMMSESKDKKGNPMFILHAVIGEELGKPILAPVGTLFSSKIANFDEFEND